MIRIGFIIDTIDTPGAGTEKQLLMLLHGLDRTRFEPTLICLRPSEWLAAQDFPFDVRFLNVGTDLRSSILGGISRFRKLQREKQFDIIQTFFVDANIFGTLAALAAGIKNIVSSRRNIGYWHTGLHTWILRLLQPLTPHYLANSRAVVEIAERAERVPPAKVTIIYNGLDLQEFHKPDREVRAAQRSTWGISDEETLVGAVANLRPVKNLASFVRAASLLVRTFPKLRFVVIGEGPERKNLQKQIRNQGLQARFMLAGAHDHVASCLAAFDIAVLCSSSESFSGSLVEYMAAGLPIVASNVGGNKEALIHGETGLLFEPEADDNLAAALREFLSNPARARKLGERAQETALQRYSSEVCIMKHENFYEHIVLSERTP